VILQQICIKSLTNCWLESTIQAAYKKGFNMIGQTDVTPNTSPEAQKVALEFTYPKFCTPLTQDKFCAKQIL